ncbi:MAG: site-specific integrase [Prevotellaceae bacterium]|jgi:site-specific recombinase XerD|nr:site-specific integrase [Prevotellaceae bacterium]
MENLSVRYVFDRKKQANETKKGLLQIEVRRLNSSKRVMISTGIRLYRNQFSSKNGFTCRNHDSAVLITGKAHRILRQIEAFTLSDKCTNIEQVKNWDNDSAGCFSVVEFMREQLKKSNPTAATMEHHSALINQVERFGKIKTFADITYENISEFDRFLKQSGVKENSTLNKRHSTFRRYIKQAIYMDRCKKDPYFEFKMPSKKGKDPVYLEESEIGKILHYEPFNEKLEHVKDLFVFQIFTGMAYIDVMNFSRDCISELDGKRILRSRREKTNEAFISLFLPEAETIAEKYDYQLPKITNQKYNDYLKLLGTGAGLRKNLTTHTARHTFATYLLNKDIPIETVSKAMGHSNIKMTQHYARLLGKKVVSDMSKLLL